ncbi:MAG: NADP-dependent succinic semialdehyde dehydrogenase [Microbacteriaceae bacterium]|jgi:succinate-semialdehyde dehydrogenase/glutarate-semialdehyde dehydrogenase|nr:NADP-dependent succinic semialdehyde dehydrogenase [Microbacteriaceae bacterium]
MAIATINPTTGQTVQTFAPESEADIETALDRAVSAFAQLRGTSFAQRAGWMRRAADLLEADADRAADMITLEMGKPLAQARAEVLKCAGVMRFYAERAETFLAPEWLPDPTAVGAARAGTIYRPIGAVLAVMPWNYPFWQVIRFAAPALMAGNVGLLKHASNVPQCALYLHSVFSRGGFPDGAFQTLLIGSARVEGIIRDPRVRAVTLTGSEPAGRSVASIAADEVKKAVLELGGSDPFVVMPSADLDRAVQTAVSARTSNNGQACINAKRFIVHRDIYDAFAERFTQAMAALVVGDPTEEATQVGPLALESGRAEVAALVDDARAKGVTVRLGGVLPEGPGWFYPPTVLEDITPAMRIHQEEAFGPVATLTRVDSLDEAIAVANDVPFGLGSAAWTADPDEQQAFLDRIDAGTVAINGMTISYPELPFGGQKRSGFGRELAGAGIREFCNLKTVWMGE